MNITSIVLTKQNKTKQTNTKISKKREIRRKTAIINALAKMAAVKILPNFHEFVRETLEF